MAFERDKRCLKQNETKDRKRKIQHKNLTVIVNAQL